MNNKIFYLLASILFIAVILTYSNHFHNTFHFDDAHSIVNNIYIKNIRNIPLFFKDGTTISSLPTNQSYRPVVATTLAIDYWLGKGLHPFYFHLSAFILFMLQGLLMYFLYLRVFNLSCSNSWNNLVALFATAWYMLHPANAETINYILARSDSLSTFFVILAFVLFMYSPFCRRWHLYLVPVALGSLTKPTAVMFGPLLLVYILLFEGKTALKDLLKRSNLGQLISAVKTALPALIFCVFLFLFTRIMEPETWTPGGTSRFYYLITQPYVLLHYFTTFFLPISLSADTDWTTLESLMDIRFFIGLSFVLILFFTAVTTSKSEKLRAVSFGILWFFISLIPTSTVIPLAEVMNDHRLFYPYVGLMMSVCWALALILMQAKKSFKTKQIFNRLAIIVILAVLALYASGTFQRNKVWRTEETLWRDVTEKSPKNGRGLMNYGLALMSKADYTGAEKYFTKAMEFTPRYPYLLINMGILKEATGKPAEAEQYFKSAISYGSGYPECHYYYARFLKNQKRIEEAVQKLIKTLELASAHLDARYMLMDIYFEESEFEKLVEFADQTLLIIPGDPKTISYLNAIKKGKSRLEKTIEIAGQNKTPENFLELSLRYYEAEQYMKSIEAAKEALKLRPDYDLAYNNICAAYNELKQWDRAIEAGEKAVKLNSNNQLARNNLAWAKSQKMISEKIRVPVNK
jgi:tetratricopeptide (TPR) repeat protein